MEQNLNKHNTSFVGVINTVCDRFQNLIENVQFCNKFGNKKQQYIRTIKRWHNPSYLGEFWEVTTPPFFQASFQLKLLYLSKKSHATKRKRNVTKEQQIKILYMAFFH